PLRQGCSTGDCGHHGRAMRIDQFERLYEEHAQPLLAFLVYRSGSRPLAEDILADTFKRVLRARRRFDPRKAGEKTWVYSIALNCLRDTMRKRAAESRAIERAVTVPVRDTRPLTDAVEDRETLAGAMDALSHEE